MHGRETEEIPGIESIMNAFDALIDTLKSKHVGMWLNSPAELLFPADSYSHREQSVHEAKADRFIEEAASRLGDIKDPLTDRSGRMLEIRASVRRFAASLVDEEDREDDRDSNPAPHAPLLEPPDGRAQRAGDEESDDENEEDRPELDQKPEGSDDENERHQGLG